jgi:CheY-like chemotaxis protein
MQAFNVILVEDNKQHRLTLVKGLEHDFKCSVAHFRDQRTFDDALERKVLRDCFNEGQPEMLILDIMLAHELDEGAAYAPRWDRLDPIPPEEAARYVDDELGYRLAERIRSGQYEDAECPADGIPYDIPILFFTARQNWDLRQRIMDMDWSDLLIKGAFVADVYDAMEVLWKACSDARR